MPELPDVIAYLDALRPRVVGRAVEGVRVLSPAVLRSYDPPIDAILGRRVVDVGRMGKRIVLAMEGELFLVVHLMIAGRFRWFEPGRRPPGKIALASLAFANGTLALTEAGTRRRATLHLVIGEPAARAFDPSGLDVLSCDAGAFAGRLRRENHTLKRSLADPRLFDGIGNAYSDEILHAAKLSPIALTSRLSDEEASRLFAAARDTLTLWIDRLRRAFGERFPGPGEITAFRPDFAVHGRFGEPCPVCATPVQRIRYAENETNYCPACQTGGKVLADRSLSRLLKDDWPRTVEELER